MRNPVSDSGLNEYADVLVNAKFLDSRVATKLEKLHKTVVNVGQNFTMFSLIGHLYMQVLDFFNPVQIHH